MTLINIDFFKDNLLIIYLILSETNEEKRKSGLNPKNLTNF